VTTTPTIINGAVTTPVTTVVTSTTAINNESGTLFVCIRGVCEGPFTNTPIVLGRATSLDTTAFFLRRQARFTGLAALGLDVRFAKHFGLKLEAGDRIWKAPINRAFRLDTLTTTIVLGPRVGKTVNQFYFTGGVSLLMGLAPPPPQPVSVMPAPPPPPAREGITVCVVDPTVSGGLKSVQALRDLNTGDTLVVTNGHTVPLSTTIPDVPVASNTDWFQSGRPLDIGTTPDKIQFVTTGGPRIVNPSDLALLGTVNGLPVYVDRSTMTRIDGLTPGTDLSFTVDQRPQVRREIEQKIPVVYVPLQSTGCVFQPMQALEKVRKGR
jgi:hypothetical protein